MHVFCYPSANLICKLHGLKVHRHAESTPLKVVCAIRFCSVHLIAGSLTPVFVQKSQLVRKAQRVSFMRTTLTCSLICPRTLINNFYSTFSCSFF